MNVQTLKSILRSDSAAHLPYLSRPTNRADLKRSIDKINHSNYLQYRDFLDLLCPKYPIIREYIHHVQTGYTTVSLGVYLEINERHTVSDFLSRLSLLTKSPNQDERKEARAFSAFISCI